MSKLLASLMRNYFPKRPSGAPLHTLSKLYNVPVGFVTPPPYFEAWILLILRSPKGGCCSISDDLSCSWFWYILGLKFLLGNFIVIGPSVCVFTSPSNFNWVHLIVAYNLGDITWPHRTGQGQMIGQIFCLLPPPPPWGPGGLSRECAPPYPQRDRKRRLNGAVCRNHRIKRLVPCRC